MEKKILLGLHNKALLESCKGLCNMMKYSVDTASTFEEMLNKVKTIEYQRYIMDLNLGCPGSVNINPAIEIYKLVGPRVKKGSVKFLGISGNFNAVNAGGEQGIPSGFTGSIDLLDFLEEVN